MQSVHVLFEILFRILFRLLFGPLFGPLTPHLLKIFIRQAGYYRIQISPNQKQTIVQVIQGQAELRIDKSSRVIKQGQTANIKEMDNSQIYTNVQRPLYDNDYNFSMNFTFLILWRIPLCK